MAGVARARAGSGIGAIAGCIDARGRFTLEADVQSIPENLTVSVEGAEIGTQFTAGQIELPEGVSLVTDPETLVVNVVAAPTAEDLEAEGGGEAGEEAAEGEAAEATEGGDEDAAEAPAEGGE